MMKPASIENLGNMKKINSILQVRYEGIGYKGIRIQPYFPVPLFLFIFIGINYFKSPYNLYKTDFCHGKQIKALLQRTKQALYKNKGNYSYVCSLKFVELFMINCVFL